MKKIIGIFSLLVAVLALTAILEPRFLTAYNLQNTIRWTSLFGIISIGGVGQASTRSVVTASIMLIIANVILVRIIFFFYPA
jgi:ribose/xylose/arabinose/galactoside ABC-type transport system permease subunit